MEEDSYRLGFSQVKPYRYYYATVSPLKGLEINGRVTEFIDIPFAEQDTAKDKAVDIKYQIIAEGKYMPALAVGIMDPHGTRLFSSQYIAASKQIYPFDVTVGFGNGRFGEEPLLENTEGIKVEMLSNPKDWLRDSQFFGGVQFSPSERFSLMAEYSPIHYHRQTRDPAQPKYFTEPVSSQFNFGIRYKPTKWSEIDVSYQRGDELGVNFSMAFDIGNPLIPIYDPFYRESPAYVNNSLPERMTRALRAVGFSDIGIAAEGGHLWIEVQNDKYYFAPKAVRIVLQRANETAPEDIQYIHVLLKENTIPQIGVLAFRADIADWFEGKLSTQEFYSLADIRTDLSNVRLQQTAYKRSFRYGIRPSLETFLNDPSGFFKYRLGLSGWAAYTPWTGATLVAGIEAYPANNISTTNEPLSIPVRSDIVLYKQEQAALGRLMVDQVYKAEQELYGRLSAGLLEVEYAGVDGEMARPVLDGRMYLGVSGSVVWKRDPDDPFKMKDNTEKDVYTTAFCNARLNIPEMDIALEVNAGRFLAGDYGARFSASKFIKGVILTAWYTVTDTSDFTDDYNRGYNDKGISVSIPLRLFAGTDSKTVYHYSLRPWSRDTGQDIEHFNPLFDFIGRNTKIHIDKDSSILYK
jgi:hypothetical protein